MTHFDTTNDDEAGPGHGTSELRPVLNTIVGTVSLSPNVTSPCERTTPVSHLSEEDDSTLTCGNLLMRPIGELSDITSHYVSDPLSHKN